MYAKKELKTRISQCEQRLVEYRKSYDEVLRASNKDIAQEKDEMSVVYFFISRRL